MVNKILKISSSSNDRLTSEIKVSFDNAPKESCKDFIQMGNKSFCFMSFGVSVSSDVKCNQIDMQKSENLNNFKLNNRMWNDEKQFDSFNNYDSGYFDEIVKMGKDAVPYILAELGKGPSPIVHALDLIFPGKVKYNGFVPLKVACDTWISILKQIGTY